MNNELIDEQAYLVSRGVRPLALLDAIGLDEAEMYKQFVQLGQITQWDAIPFVLPRKDMNCAMTGFAAAQWVIDLLAWSYANAPLQHHHQIIGLLLGYSVNAIAKHDARQFAGKPAITSKSTQRTDCTPDKA